VLGRTFTFDHVATMLGVTPSRLLDPVEELKRAEVFVDSGEALGFRHDIIREAVLDSTPVSASRALDRQAAEMLLHANVVPLEIVGRLAETAEPGDEVVIATLRQGAHALAATDPAAARTPLWRNAR
jgi:hypothetical protein